MPKRLVLDNFLGGRNTLDAIYNVNKNQTTAGGENCWAENKTISNRRGFTAVASEISSITCTPRQLLLTHMASGGAVRLLILGHYAHASNPIAGLMYTENGTSFTAVGYTTGTISTAGSSTTVTGASTVWSTNVRIGDYLLAGGLWTRITAVNSDTDITIATARNYSAGTAYIIVQAVSQTKTIGMTLFNDGSATQVAYINDGARGAALKYNGTTVTEVDAFPDGNKILVHKNYMFVLRHNNTDIRWSALKDADTWNASNFQTVTADNNPTRGMAIYGDHIVIFCNRKMFRLIGDTFDPSNPTYVLEEIGVPSHFLFYWPRTVVIHNGVLKFLAADGWYAYDGGTNIEKISQIIQADADNVIQRGAVEEVWNDAAVAIVQKGRMWVSVYDTTESNSTLNTIFVQDERDAWWKWPIAGGRGFTDFVLWGATLFGAGYVGTNDGLFTLDTGRTDAHSGGTAISSEYVTTDFLFDEETEFIEAVVYMVKQAAGSLTFRVSIDQASYISFTLSMTAGVATDIIQKRVPIGRMGKTIRLDFTHATAAETYSVKRIDLIYEPTEAVRI